MEEDRAPGSSAGSAEQDAPAPKSKAKSTRSPKGKVAKAAPVVDEVEGDALF